MGDDEPFFRNVGLSKHDIAAASSYFHVRLFDYIPAVNYEVTVIAENNEGISAETVRTFAKDTACNETGRMHHRITVP